VLTLDLIGDLTFSYLLLRINAWALKTCRCLKSRPAKRFQRILQTRRELGEAAASVKANAFPHPSGTQGASSVHRHARPPGIALTLALSDTREFASPVQVTCHSFKMDLSSVSDLRTNLSPLPPIDGMDVDIHPRDWTSPAKTAGL